MSAETVGGPEELEAAGSFVARLVEAAVFASSEPVGERALAELLRSREASNGEEEALDRVRSALRDLKTLYASRGVTLVEVAGGWQFRTAPDLAPILTKVLQRPRRLPRAAMEVLAIIAYHQPCTRTDVESIRGVSLGQQTIDGLLEAGLIMPKGRKEVPGRPTLWGTTPGFLKQFGLRDLRDLPRREELLVELPTLPPAEADPAGTPATVTQASDPA